MIAIKPKEALVKDGFLPEGSDRKRGRLSAAGIERCKELASQGWDIEGYEVSQGTDSSPVVEKVKVDPNRVYDIPEATRPEDSWTAWTGTKQIGMRTVCNNCKCSLTYCPCPSPKVWVDHETEAVVHFKPLNG